MTNVVVESVQEFRNLRDINEAQEINEGLFTSLKNEIDTFLKDPKDEKKANALLSQSFAKQFAGNVRTKEFILKFPLDKKIEILKMSTEKLKDSKMGILKLIKNQAGKLVVGGTGVKGGASHVTTGA